MRSPRSSQGPSSRQSTPKVTKSLISDGECPNSGAVRRPTALYPATLPNVSDGPWFRTWLCRVAAGLRQPLLGPGIVTPLANMR